MLGTLKINKLIMPDFLNSITSLPGNPLFGAGFGLLGVGALLASLRKGGQNVINLLQQRFITTLEMTSRDPLYRGLVDLLSQQKLLSGSHFTCTTTLSTFPQFTPSPGTHYIRFQSSLIQIRRERQSNPLQSHSHSEILTLRTVGKDSETLKRILYKAYENEAKRTKGLLQILTPFAGEWRLFGDGKGRLPRPLSSVILRSGVSEEIIDDVEAFLKRGPWYEERGIPYRRGYLLWGPPGTGKSSFVEGLAGHLGYSICLLNFSSSPLSDDRLLHLLNCLPSRTILLIEDIDSLYLASKHGGSRSDTAAMPAPTMSALLNALDGVAASEERIIFMTSNDPSKLDPALIRPGRVDRKIKIDLVDLEQSQRMFRKFYPSYKGFSKWTVQHRSSSLIQSHFIKWADDPDGAVENAKEIYCCSAALKESNPSYLCSSASSASALSDTANKAPDPLTRL